MVAPDLAGEFHASRRRSNRPDPPRRLRQDDGVARPATCDPAAGAGHGSQIRSTYVISEDSKQHARINRHVAAQLRSKVTEETLLEIARDIRSIEPLPLTRLTDITFSVPKQIPDGPDNPWATAVFRPDLDVKILGLTPEREKQFRSVPRPSGPEVVGTWLVENTRYAQLVTIFKSGEDARLEERSEPAGPSRAVELAEVATSKGRRFKRPGSRQDSRVAPDQVYDIDSDGVLRIRVNDELYSSARPLR